MSTRDDWAAGWQTGREHGDAVASASGANDGSEEAPSRPAVDPGNALSLEAWEDGYLTGYANATGSIGGRPLSANPYPKTRVQ